MKKYQPRHLRYDREAQHQGQNAQPQKDKNSAGAPDRGNGAAQASDPCSTDAHSIGTRAVDTRADNTRVDDRHVPDEAESTLPDTAHPLGIPVPDPGDGGEYVPIPGRGGAEQIAPNGAVIRNPWSQQPEILPDYAYIDEQQDQNLLIM